MRSIPPDEVATHTLPSGPAVMVNALCRPARGRRKISISALGFDPANHHLNLTFEAFNRLVKIDVPAMKPPAAVVLDDSVGLAGFRFVNAPEFVYWVSPGPPMAVMGVATPWAET